jgi:hypothetical protein
MNKNFKSLAIGALLAGITQLTAHAQIVTIGEWNFATDPGGGIDANAAFSTAQPTETTAVDQTVTPFTPPTGVTLSNLIIGPAAVYTPGASEQAYEGFAPTISTTGVAADITGGNYEAFTLTVNPGYTLSLNDISTSVGFYNSGNYYGTSYLASSLTGTSVALGSGANGYDWSSYFKYSHALSPFDTDLTSANSAAGTAFQNLTSASGPITFYVAMDASAYYNNGVQNLVINGTLTATAVPEPSTYALLGMGLLALVVVGRRKACLR